MRRAMEYARGFDLTVMDHCDDKSLAAGGVMHEGEWSLRLGLRGIPALAEESDAARDCALAELTGARVHLAHVSTRGAIDAVRRAKERGAQVTCEVAPHHFTLTDAACEGFDTNMKMNPPLRSREHSTRFSKPSPTEPWTQSPPTTRRTTRTRRSLSSTTRPSASRGSKRRSASRSTASYTAGASARTPRRTLLRQPRAHLPPRRARHAPPRSALGAT
jgi:hypothetical protein